VKRILPGFACLALLCGCAVAPSDPPAAAAGASQAAFLQCVVYARAHSAVKLFGDAYEWWDKAAGKYARGAHPLPGAVMTLTGYAEGKRGHLAVVRVIVSAREIRVDHANWLNDGAVYLNNPVRDESAGNDWSLVRVWNIQANAWGSRLYPVQGFIGPDAADAPDRIAREPGDAGHVLVR
jgi:surface antigen